MKKFHNQAQIESSQFTNSLIKTSSKLNCVRRLISFTFVQAIFIIHFFLPCNAISETLIYSSWNEYSVRSGPLENPIFSTVDEVYISTISNYHWINHGTNNLPGFIGIVQIDPSSGTDLFAVGSWQAYDIHSDDAYWKNAVWVANPNIVLSIGTYKIVDSSHSTWSYSIQSGYNDGANWASGRGFSQVYISEIPNPDPVPEPATMILFGTGLAGLTAACRRKKAC